MFQTIVTEFISSKSICSLLEERLVMFILV